jgi:hypothetical protein
MTNEQLFTILEPIIRVVTGVPVVILADQNHPAPKGVYATVRPRQSIVERGQANITVKDIPDDKVSTDVRAQIIATCSVNFYRGDAVGSAEKLKQCNKRPDVSMNLFKNKLGWLSTDAVNNLTALQSNNWEQRAQVNIKLMYEVSNYVEINDILSTQIIAENEKGSVLQIIDVP